MKLSETTSNSPYSIELLEEKTIENWFGFGNDNEKNRKIISRDISEKSHMRRFLVYNADDVVGRFSVVFSKKSVTAWCPKLIENIDEINKQKTLDAVAEYISRLFKFEGLEFAECTIKSESENSIGWRSALIKYGFRVVSQKHVWVFEDLNQVNPKIFNENKDARLSFVKEMTPLIEIAYRKTAHLSLDKALSIEINHGEAIGDFEFLITKSYNDEIVGLCVCERDTITGKDWIKYIGVCPESRGQNYAVMMANQAIKALKALGSSKIYSFIDDDNIPSILLHKKLGFERTNEKNFILYAE